MSNVQVGNGVPETDSENILSKLVVISKLYCLGLVLRITNLSQPHPAPLFPCSRRLEEVRWKLMDDLEACSGNSYDELS